MPAHDTYQSINNIHRTPNRIGAQHTTLSIQQSASVAMILITYNTTFESIIDIYRLITSNTQNEHGNDGQYIQQLKSLPGIDLATIYTRSAQYGNSTCEQCDENEIHVRYR